MHESGSWTREDFVRRSAAGALALGTAFAPRWVGDALAAVGKEPVTVHRFHSRTDLVPPIVTVLEHREGVSAGHLFLAPNSGPGHRGPLLVDDFGHVIWTHNTRPVTAMNFRAGVYKGKPVLTWWEGRTTRGLGDGTHVIVDNSYREVLRVPAGNKRPSDLHEFVLTDRGTALVTAWERQTGNLSGVGGPSSGPVIGGVVQEIELPSGRVLFEWRSLDHVAIDESHQPYSAKGAYDYFHVNSVELDHDGNYLVSARNTWAVYKIDRHTGKVLWRLGGKKSDFKMGPGTVFAWQHDARRHGGSNYLLSLFDDGAMPPVQPQSKALVLELDLRRMTASVYRKLTHRPSVLAWALGSVQVLPNHNVLVGWGTSPYITEYDREGRVVFDARLPKGGENYRALRMPWKGLPAKAPDLIRKYEHGKHVVYASWNGATELAAWRVEATGNSSAYRKTGFETKLVAPGGVKRIEITPLDHKGKPLHAAKAIKV
ncbi:MAG TPA: arylsulfotransferase family protein [Gaiellaceae bacterium]|nr:arylsulfotransferase family protein [Gaiellaceae bacterium]